MNEVINSFVAAGSSVALTTVGSSGQLVMGRATRMNHGWYWVVPGEVESPAPHSSPLKHINNILTHFQYSRPFLAFTINFGQKQVKSDGTTMLVFANNRPKYALHSGQRLRLLVSKWDLLPVTTKTAYRHVLVHIAANNRLMSLSHSMFCMTTW